jgi:deoxyribodipyrimidine photo-lyase
MNDAPVIVWFRDDLRLHDHAALAAAAKKDAPLICLYVLDETSKGFRPHGAASRWWLHHSLTALDADLKKHGLSLVLRSGAAATVVPAVAAETKASAVFWNRRYDQPGIAVDEQVVSSLKGKGVGGSTFAGNLLAEPSAFDHDKTGGPKVFTPFWKRLRALGDPRAPVALPRKWPSSGRAKSDLLADWKLLPTKPDWAGGMRSAWKPGEAEARKQLRKFLDHLSGYDANRNRPDLPATSRLSPYLRFGEVSPNEIFYATRFAAQKDSKIARDSEKFLSEVGWREFSYQLLHYHPHLATENLQSRFDDFPWKTDKSALKAWQKGRTGYPIVDAGMRELWHTGWMHNRVRMVVASFLIKHLLIDWRQGEAWFWDTLVDADPANNTASWQWVAGCGADAAPYFRIFNPVLQGEKFDPDGNYVRQWVPEIAKLPNEFLNKPWEADAATLSAAGVTLGKTYPKPIVDHAFARERALAALKTIKTST